MNRNDLKDIFIDDVSDDREAPIHGLPTEERRTMKGLNKKQEDKKETVLSLMNSRYKANCDTLKKQNQNFE